MRVGDVVATTSINAMTDNMTAGFKAPMGSRFVFVFLGLEGHKGGERLDAHRAMESLGWKLDEADEQPGATGDSVSGD